MARQPLIGSARLSVYIAENFASAGLSDREFAQQATQALGVPVKMSHVALRRRALNIPATSTRRPPRSAVEHEAALLNLHRRVTVLERAVARLTRLITRAQRRSAR